MIMMTDINSFTMENSIQKLSSDTTDNDNQLGALLLAPLPVDENADYQFMSASEKQNAYDDSQPIPANSNFTMADSIQKLISETGIFKENGEDPVLLSRTPVEVPDGQFAESVYAQSISAMAASEREDAYDDIHAIPVGLPEDPVLIEQSLEQLEYEIEMREDNQAYQLAKVSNPAYVLDRSFRLLFLKADRYDAKKAAFRMTRHFQMKMEVFGKEKLGRDILQDDFDEDDIKVLYEGNVQLLPAKDRGGRNLLLVGSYSGMPEAIVPKRRMRRFFYLLMLASRDAGSIVVLSYHLYENMSPEMREVNLTAAKMLPSLFDGMPVHLAAVHLGYDSDVWAPVESVLKFEASVDLRVRMRKLQGTVKDWRDSVKSYGIHPDQVPLSDDGAIEKAEYQNMLRNIRVKERRQYPQMITRNHIMSPGPFDVVFGKGSRYQDHEGNVRLRKMLVGLRKAYDKAKRGEKRAFMNEVVETVKQASGLFLKDDGPDGWSIVDDEAAATKVGGIFRTLRAFEM